MASSAASRAAAAARPGVAYSLGRTLYLSVTNRSNAASILDTRGPGFRMPESSGFLLLPTDAPEPTSDELAAVVDACYADADIVGMGENDPGVVFAGAGEPLLRPDVLVDVVRKTRDDFSRHGVLFRVHTNGLHPPSVVAALADAAVDRVTVALATADPRQYDALMRPHRNAGGHADVRGLRRRVRRRGRPRRAWRRRPGAPVDVAAARKLAHALGAVEFRTRDYFP